MRTCVRVRRSHDSPRGPRLVLRVCRAARRSGSARAAGDRRRGRRARGELRGEGVRGADRYGRAAGAAIVPFSRRGAAANVGVYRREQSRVRGLRADDPAGRGPVDRRGFSRRARHGADCGNAARDRGAIAPRRAGARRPAHHRRRRAHEVPREGRERRGQTGWPACRAARRRTRVPAPAPRRAAVGRGRGHGAEAARAGTSRRSARSRGWRSRRSCRWSGARRAGSSMPSLTIATRGRSGDDRGADRWARNVRWVGGGGRPRNSTRSRRAGRPLARRMRAARRVCRTVVLRLRFDDFSRATRSRTMTEATAHTADDPRPPGRCSRSRRR